MVPGHNLGIMVGYLCIGYRPTGSHLGTKRIVFVLYPLGYSFSKIALYWDATWEQKDKSSIYIMSSSILLSRHI